MREERWQRFTLEQNEADEGDQSDAEALGVRHRPGCAIPDTGCAQTLICHSAQKRHVRKRATSAFQRAPSEVQGI